MNLCESLLFPVNLLTVSSSFVYIENVAGSSFILLIKILTRIQPGSELYEDTGDRDQYKLRFQAYSDLTV